MFAGMSLLNPQRPSETWLVRCVCYLLLELRCMIDPCDTYIDIFHVPSQLVKRFMLDLDAAHDLQLSSGGFTLPHTGRISLLRDGDIVSIASLTKAVDPTNEVSALLR